jgi:hypothetical protein
MPTGIPNKPPNEKIASLLRVRMEIGQRIAEERKRLKAIGIIARAVERYGLTAAELRMIATNMGRKKSDKPVASKHRANGKARK